MQWGAVRGAVGDGTWYLAGTKPNLDCKVRPYLKVPPRVLCRRTNRYKKASHVKITTKTEPCPFLCKIRRQNEVQHKSGKGGGHMGVVVIFLAHRVPK